MFLGVTILLRQNRLQVQEMMTHSSTGSKLALYLNFWNLAFNNFESDLK